MTDSLVIGLGNLGLAVGRRLLLCGDTVRGVDVSENRRQIWKLTAGTDAFSTIGEVPWGVIEHVFVVVRSVDQVERVLLGLEGVPIGGDQDVPCYILSTLSPAFAKSLGRFGTATMRIVELPVTGAETGALSGTLTGMSAGSLRRAERVYLLNSLFERIVPFDEYGQPSLVKLINNAVVAYNVATLSWALTLASGYQLRPRDVREVISNGTGTSYAAKAIFELVGPLLTKDVELLREHLGDLPEVGVWDGGVEEALSSLRSMLEATPELPDQQPSRG